jgi:hypothetical protein
MWRMEGSSEIWSVDGGCGSCCCRRPRCSGPWPSYCQRRTGRRICRAEDLAERARAHRVHGVGLEVHEDGARDEAATASLIVVDVDALELEVGVAGVLSGVVDAMLVAYQASQRWDSWGMGARERTGGRAVAVRSRGRVEPRRWRRGEGERRRRWRRRGEDARCEISGRRGRQNRAPAVVWTSTLCS